MSVKSLPVRYARNTAVVIGLIAAWGATAYLAYASARASYRQVGFNDGQIDQQGLTIATIERITHVQDCATLRNSGRKETFVSSKADTVYAVVAADGGTRFCRQW